jgi:hypothetical protein
MLKEAVAAGFSKENVREFFSLLERTVVHKFNDIIYLYNVDDSAFTTFKEKTGKSLIEKRNIAYLVSLKCEESNHYSSSHCLLCQRC